MTYQNIVLFTKWGLKSVSIHTKLSHSSIFEPLLMLKNLSIINSYQRFKKEEESTFYQQEE